MITGAITSQIDQASSPYELDELFAPLQQRAVRGELGACIKHRH